MRDFKHIKKSNFPTNMIGRHSLESWGHRMGILKGNFETDWKNWSPEMQSAYDIAEGSVISEIPQSLRRKLLGIKPFYNKNAIKMIKPKKEVCDIEYYSHILDQESIGTILLDNTYYKSTNDIFGERRTLSILTGLSMNLFSYHIQMLME